MGGKMFVRIKKHPVALFFLLFGVTIICFMISAIVNIWNVQIPKPVEMTLGVLTALETNVLPDSEPLITALTITEWNAEVAKQKYSAKPFVTVLSGYNGIFAQYWLRRAEGTYFVARERIANPFSKSTNVGGAFIHWHATWSFKTISQKTTMVLEAESSNALPDILGMGLFIMIVGVLIVMIPFSYILETPFFSE